MCVEEGVLARSVEIDSPRRSAPFQNADTNTDSLFLDSSGDADP